MAKEKFEPTLKMVDPICGHYIVSIGKGRELGMFCSQGRLSLRDINNGGDEVGRIVISTARSGSLWRGSECIGEYSLDDGQYRVVPLDDGLLQPDRVEKTHPLNYMLRRSTL